MDLILVSILKAALKVQTHHSGPRAGDRCSRSYNSSCASLKMTMMLIMMISRVTMMIVMMVDDDKDET